jgi:uncharacterized protein YbjT (DUF2867 family)
MITVMGATGNTGGKIAESLLQAGEKVRALGRSESKLARFKNASADVLTGDAADSAFLTRAFRGSDAVYTLLPPDLLASDPRAAQDRQGEAIVKAILESGVRHVIFLSSLGAEHSEGTGPIAGLHAQEERLRRLSGLNVIFLRATFFFENFYSMLGVIKQKGINANSLAADLSIPMVATRDIADVAAKALKVRNWTGSIVREVLGPRDLSIKEATRIFGERIGKPDLKYEQVSYARQTETLMQAGVSEKAARLYVQMTRAFNEGMIQPLKGRSAENTTTTRFEDFAGELARVYEKI